jgi:hypothetical protein
VAAAATLCAVLVSIALVALLRRSIRSGSGRTLVLRILASKEPISRVDLIHACISSLVVPDGQYYCCCNYAFPEVLLVLS